MIGVEMVQACAPGVAPGTIQRVIWIESRNNPLAIGVNRGRLPRKPRDAADAAALARAAIQQGYSVDLGLMQVNSNNLAKLGYSVEDMFEPCKNLAAGARVLTEFFLNAKPRFSDEQAALRAALSAYNTGSYSRGFSNGYVAQYVGASALTVPPLSNIPMGSPVARPTPAVERPRPPSPYTIQSVVFKREAKNTMDTVETTQPVITRNDDDAATPGVQVEHTAESAARAGAFRETALSEADAWDSNVDLHSTAIVVKGKTVSARKE